MRKIRLTAIALLTVLAAFVVVPIASAHPLGNFTINHYAGIQVSPTRIAVDFVLDMAEIPAFQEIAGFDANGNGQPDPEESAKYHPVQCAAIASQLDLRLNGRALPLHLDSSSIAFPPGAGGLLTLRLTCEFSTPVDLAGKKAQLQFADHSYADRIGWREIVVTSNGVSLHGSYTSTSISQRLTAYPKDLLTDPLNQRQMTLDILPAGASASSSTAAASPAAQPGGAFSMNRNDAFTRLITVPNFTPLSFLFALLIAFVWGALHAVTPGHGKTIVGAYLVGSRGTARHALFLGLTTTITHTAGVFALGLVTLFAARFIVPEKLFPWLSLVSGLLVALIGLWMLLTRAREAGLLPHGEPVHHDHHEHVHESDELHHRHSHDGHDHDHVHSQPLPHAHDHDHNVDGHTHSHLPPGADGEPVTWRSILALGISGGILPCPSALIVLLSAIALDRIALGLALVLAFSAGLAGVLSAIGIVFVYAGRLFQLSPKKALLLRVLPVGSALVIAAAGVLVAVQALAQIGWIRL